MLLLFYKLRFPNYIRMEIKPIYIRTFLISVLVLLFLFDSFSFLTSSASGLNIIPAWAVFSRNFLLLFSAFIFFFLKLGKTEIKKPDLVTACWKNILWLGGFLILAITVSYFFTDSGFHKTNAGESQIAQFEDLPSDPAEASSDGEVTEPSGKQILLPNSFSSLVVSYLFGIGLFIFIANVWVTLRNFVYFKRTPRFELHFKILLGLIFTISVAELVLPVLTSGGSGTQVLMIFLYILVAVFLGLNSFRLGWVLYLSRKEKILSIILIFVFEIICIILLSTNLLNQGDTIAFLSPFLIHFIRLTLIYLISYAGISFFSILFHLPTTEVFERKSSELSSLHSLSKLVSNVFDLNELSQAVVNYSLQTTSGSIGWLEIYQTKKSESPGIKILAPRQITSTEIQDLFGHSDENLRSRLVSTRVLQVIDRAEGSSLLHASAVKIKKIGSIAAIPLIARGELVGGLFILKQVSGGFDKDDADTLTTFADQAAVAIDNTRLFEASLERERLQQELFIAQKMQMKLLPQANPVIESLEVESVSYPAYEVGGDYYDFISVPDGRFGIIVADVSGKGTSAAFYMAEVKGIFQSLARIFYSPKLLLLEANTVLYGSLDRKSFVSLLYCVFDVKTGILTQSRAGHCPLLVVRADGTGTYLKTPGVGIGLGSSVVIEPKLEETSLTLEVGDVCVLYSDGVVEAMNEEMAEFGYDRLKDVVIQNRHRSAKEILDQLITEINTFIWNGKASDDLTLVVTKWKGSK